MAYVCDTATAAPADRAELWVAAVSELIVPVECVPRPGGVFGGRMRAGSVGPVHFCGLEVTPHTIQRTRKLTANSRGDLYKLSLMLGGESLIVQDGREAVLRPGDYAIYDCSRPYTLVGSDRFRMLVCILPHDIVGMSTERISAITATRIAGDTGVAWAMAPFMRRLANLAIRDEPPIDAYPVTESLVDLVESLCATALGGQAGPRPHSRAELLLRIRAYIKAHLGDPELCPARIASAHYISKRYLHKLFEEEGVSVSRWIREQRLERCRRDLADPGSGEDTVTNIATRWGFTDGAHFSHLFRDAFDCAPSVYRQRHLSA